MSEFNRKVIGIVNSIPRGRVMTYGQIAAWLGVPRAAQAVGWTLHWVQSDAVPCQRVVNRFGGLATGFGWGGQAAHKILLLADGVEVRADFTVDLEKYQWWPEASELPNLEFPIYYQKELDQKLPVERVQLSHKALTRKSNRRLSKSNALRQKS